MTASIWQDKQLELGRTLVNQGSQALRQGDVNTADAAFAEARVILEMYEEQSEDHKKLLAQVLNETGFILQRVGQTEQAIRNHREAVELCDVLIEEGVEFRANAAATNINLAGLLAGAGQMEEAKAANRRAITLTGALLADGEDSDHARLLAFGARQNYSMIVARDGGWDEAASAMRDSLELLDTVVAAGNKPVIAQAAQGCQQLSVLAFQNERYDEALTWGLEAETLSERAYAELGEQALPIYVTSEINLISFHEKQGSFAESENSLHKALEVVGNHPQLLARGKAFYEECRKQADSRLEKGDLPRDEVEDGLADMLERIEEIGGLPEIEPDENEA